jgi:hypothetical protein
MNAASEGWDMTCRTIGECRFGPRVNREFGDGVAAPGGLSNWTGAKQFAYVRYDPDVTAEGLADLGLPDIQPDDVQLMDSVAHVKDIQRVGEAYAKNVALDHLRNFI